MNAKHSPKTYCLICKKLTDNTNSKTIRNKGRLMMKSICLVYGNKKKQIYGMLSDN